MNPQLDDESPAEAIAADRLRDVMTGSAGDARAEPKSSGTQRTRADTVIQCQSTRW
jgi:hypothetical protein